MRITAATLALSIGLPGMAFAGANVGVVVQPVNPAIGQAAIAGVAASLVSAGALNHTAPIMIHSPLPSYTPLSPVTEDGPLTQALQADKAFRDSVMAASPIRAAVLHSEPVVVPIGKSGPGEIDPVDTGSKVNPAVRSAVGKTSARLGSLFDRMRETGAIGGGSAPSLNFDGAGRRGAVTLPSNGPQKQLPSLR